MGRSTRTPCPSGFSRAAWTLGLIAAIQCLASYGRILEPRYPTLWHIAVGKRLQERDDRSFLLRGQAEVTQLLRIDVA